MSSYVDASYLYNLATLSEPDNLTQIISVKIINLGG